MTEKELRKLSRVELLKLLVEVTEENEMLRAQLQGQQELLQRTQIQDSQEVRDSVEDVFRTVESTATGFLSKAQGIADQIVEDARVRAEGIIRDAEVRAATLPQTAEAAAVTEEAPAEAQPYEPFTAAAPEMQQVIEEIALEQSPQQSAEDAFETDALFEGTNATEVTEKRLTEVRVTEPEPLPAEPEEEAEEDPHADIPVAEIATEAYEAKAYRTEAETYEAEAETEEEAKADEPEPEAEDSEEPDAYVAAKPRRAPQTRGGVRPVAPAFYPGQAAEPEDNFRIEGLEDAPAPQWFTETAQATPLTPQAEPQTPQTETPAEPQEKPLTAIDMLKRLQGGGS